MTPRWQQFAARIDALSLRERVLAFAAIAGVIVYAAYFAGLGPMLDRQTRLRAQVSQQQNNLTGMDAEIEQKILEYQRDPDLPTKERLQAVNNESTALGDSLRAVQKGLVTPERMAPLVDSILRANGRLHLVAMHTLPVTSLNEAPGGAAVAEPKPEAGSAPANDTAAKLAAVKAAMAAAANGAGPAKAPATAPAVSPKPGSLLYRHGVEVTVRGSYMDMIDYMNALETLPTQLFWGGARLEVEDYPTARLTLTMYTLSLDSKWLKL